MYKRPHFYILKERLEEKKKFIQVITGPRQVGKTTLVKQLIEEINIPSHYASADAIGVSDIIWIEQQWDIVRTIQKQKKMKEIILVIDEVQKIANWSEQVKAEWDKDEFEGNIIKVVLLGSASLLIQKGLGESLMGRYETINMLHWSFEEMNSAFNFSPEEYVWFGGYPGSAELIKDEQRWKQYVQDALIEPTISKDLLMMTRIDKPSLFKKLFELACSYSGQLLSYSKMLGQLQDAGNTTTLTHYLNLLNNAALVGGINKIYKEKVRQTNSIPKLQVYNSALLTSQSNASFDQIQLNPEMWGRHVESAIGAHLINESRIADFQLFYWRHRNNEVDFVLKRGKTIIGLEVKSGRTQQSKGLNAFKQLFAPLKIILIGNTGLKWQEFLKINPGELF